MKGLECGEEGVDGSADDFERGVQLVGGCVHCGGGSSAHSRKTGGFRGNGSEGKMT